MDARVHNKSLLRSTHYINGQWNETSNNENFNVLGQYCE